MANLSPAKVIRRVRKSLELSQEALSRLLNATKGAVQHWERGRNNPDLARLLALRQLCAAGPERRELDTLIKQTQSHVAPLPAGKQAVLKAKQIGRGARQLLGLPGEGLTLLRRENHRLERQVAKLGASLERRNEQVRVLQDLVGDLERQMAQLRGGHSDSTPQADAASA